MGRSHGELNEAARAAHRTRAEWRFAISSDDPELTLDDLLSTAADQTVGKALLALRLRDILTDTGHVPDLVFARMSCPVPQKANVGWLLDGRVRGRRLAEFEAATRDRSSAAWGIYPWGMPPGRGHTGRGGMR